MPYKNCITLSVDNASTMVGVNNSVASQFKTKNQKISTGECPCHLAHISASHANDSFSDVLGLKIFAFTSFIGSTKVPRGSFTKLILTVYEVDLDNSNLFKHRSSIFLGMTTRATLNRLLENGNISPEKFDKVNNAVYLMGQDKSRVMALC